MYVPEAKLSSLTLGSAVTVHVDGSDQALNGKIDFISPKIEFAPPVIYSQAMRSKFVALVEVVFEPAVATTLHPGQPVDVVLSR
jgi:HlyD family secretion protein